MSRRPRPTSTGHRRRILLPAAPRRRHTLHGAPAAGSDAPEAAPSGTSTETPETTSAPQTKKERREARRAARREAAQAEAERQAGYFDARLAEVDVFHGMLLFSLV